MPSAETELLAERSCAASSANCETIELGEMSASRRSSIWPLLSTSAARTWEPETLIPMKFVPGVVIANSLSGRIRRVERSIDEGFGAVKLLIPRVECGRDEENRMQIRTILLPTDFSECGNYALSYAASLARTFRASIICINVIEPIVPTVGYSGMTEPLPIADIAEQLEDSAERELPKLAECEECSGLEVEELVVHGEAASEIVRVARERGVDLIVISSHGRTGLGRIIFGSTAESVVRHAPCPVLVVKPPQEEETNSQ